MNTRLIPRLGRTVAVISLVAAATATLQSMASSGVNGPMLKSFAVAATNAGMPQTAQTMWASVDGTGAIANSFPRTTTTASRIQTGNYEVDFYQKVDACSYQATVGPAGGGSAQGYATVAARASNTKGVFVETFNTSGVVTDMPFHLAVHC